jgi:hypothetical protein
VNSSRAPSRVTILVAGSILERTDPENRRGFGLASPQKRTNASAELGKGKWLDEIVVRTGIETRYAVLHRVSGREKQHLGRNGLASQSTQDFQSVTARQHHVEEDQIERLAAGQEKAFFARASEKNVISFREQTVAQAGAHLRLSLQRPEVSYRSSFRYRLPACTNGLKCC